MMIIEDSFSDEHKLTIEDKLMIIDGLYEDFSEKNIEIESYWFHANINWKEHKNAFFEWLLASLVEKEKAKGGENEVSRRK